MFNLVIGGSRVFDNYDTLVKVVDSVLSYLDVDNSEVVLVSGCCSGADALGLRLAFERGWPVLRFPALWGRYGRSAGPIRNKEMAKVANACVLFPVAGVACRGTHSMAVAARSAGALVFAARC